MWGEDIEAKENIRPSWVCFTLLLLCFLLPSSAFGLRTAKLDLNGLLERTAFIFTGKVQAVDFAAGEQSPRTRITFRVQDIVAGHSVPPIFDVELPMGLMADGTVLDIAEAPRFVVGQSYLVLYKRGTWNITPVVGFHQGHYRRVDGEHGAVYVSEGGRCVTGLDRQGFVLGPRVTPRLGYMAFGDAGSEAFDPARMKGCLSASALLTSLVEHVADFGELNSDVYDTVPASDILFQRLMGSDPKYRAKKGDSF